MTSSNRLKILIADDDEISRNAMIFMLTHLGCDVCNTLDGEEVIEVLKCDTFDALILDIELPEYSGLEIISLVRAGKLGDEIKSIPAFAVTGYGGSIAEKCSEAGFTRTLHKPVSIDDVSSIIAEIPRKTAVHRTKKITLFDMEREMHLEEMRKTFFAGYTTSIEEIKTALDNRNINRAAMSVHRFKSSIAAVREEAAFNYANELEEAIMENNIEKSLKLIETLRKYLEKSAYEFCDNASNKS